MFWWSATCFKWTMFVFPPCCSTIWCGEALLSHTVCPGDGRCKLIIMLIDTFVTDKYTKHGPLSLSFIAKFFQNIWSWHVQNCLQFQHVCTIVSSFSFRLHLSAFCAPVPPNLISLFLSSPLIRLEATEAGQWHGGLHWSPLSWEGRGWCFEFNSIPSQWFFLITAPGIRCFPFPLPDYWESNLTNLL